MITKTEYEWIDFSQHIPVACLVDFMDIDDCAF